MSAQTRGNQEYRLACIGFGPAEIDAAGRLIALLGTNLKQRWRLVGPGEYADVALANLDAEIDPGALRHGTIAYCARKPSEHRQAALHLPLRSYELLNLLNVEAPAGAAGTRNDGADEHAAMLRYRLRAWPLQANDWTRERWRLMAAIRHRYRSANGLALQTGIAIDQVQQCLDELDRLGALERGGSASRAESPSALPPSGWRELAARVGQLLGFAR